MKKNLKLLVLLFMVVILVTGCGKTTKNNTSISGSSEETSTSTKSRETIAVNSLLAISDNYAIVSTSEGPMIIDKDGIYQGQLEKTVQTNYIISKNGYVMTKSGEGVKLYDKSGKQLLKSNSNVDYEFGVSDSNYLIRNTKVKDYEKGTTTKREVIDVNGKVIHELNVNDYTGPLEFIAFDVYATPSSSFVSIGEKFAVDVKQNKITANNLESHLANDSDYEDWEYKVYTLNENVVNPLSGSYYVSNKGNVYKISDGYLLADDIYYSREEHAVKKYSTNEVLKDFSSEPHSVLVSFINNKYYVNTTTDYIDVYDKNFNKIGKPYNISAFEIGIYGIFSRSEGTLTDFDMKTVSKLPYTVYSTDNHFVGKDYNNSGKYVNLNTKKILEIYK